MSEYEPTPEIRKEQWLSELTDFLTESCRHGWAANTEKTLNSETGEKTLVYSRDQWMYRDTYTGYFAAPGESKVYHKGKHVWTMHYGGEGQKSDYFDEAKATYSFLKEALMNFDADLPLRGPQQYYSDDNIWAYRFKMFEGNIESGVWREEIDKQTREKGDFRVYFSQVGTCGIITDKSEDYTPIYPWDI